MSDEPRDQLDVQTEMELRRIGRQVAAIRAAIDRWFPRPMPDDFEREGQ